MPVIGQRGFILACPFPSGQSSRRTSLDMFLPDSDSVNIVLSNSLALNNVPDWVGQLLLEEGLEVPESERNDFIGPAKAAVAENLKWYPRLTKELEEARKNGTSPRNLDEYVGVYWIDVHVFKIVVTVEDGKLYWALQGLDSEKFELKHYEDDTFLWLLPRNELSRRGRWVGSDQGPSFWTAEFRAMNDGTIDELYWAHDTDVPPLKLAEG